ncbi:MAG: hypothetical protein F4059_07900 [Gemmatimonadetes bacterium]|nr:hypothetical protein [Gemmatimonadota bacterium]
MLQIKRLRVHELNTAMGSKRPGGTSPDGVRYNCIHTPPVWMIGEQADAVVGETLGPRAGFFVTAGAIRETPGSMHSMMGGAGRVRNRRPGTQCRHPMIVSGSNA